MTTRYVIGCDPGLGGAFAVLHIGDDGAAIVERCEDLPKVGAKVRGKRKQKIDAGGLVRLVRDLAAARPISGAIVEAVNAAPGMGVSGAFSFGRGAGIIEAALIAAGIVPEFVAPAVWKRAMRAPADKRLSRARATELFGGSDAHWPLSRHDGRAEAAMVALYGVKAGVI
ncbi:hypothetical protein [Enterovirga aerilata]|uniref:Uncharacterized protein n=1 Tax=Enterovirga aerilata TaxID=2730920 RepID=A0A849ILD0_9HYPH|nr:hypothetical protein [Enterovirga sp. DB1703]NNM74763.1 hypothetical protein [Enterovirga sp. DB1703]